MIVALIPARSGSKRVKDKNIRPLGGYPLMAWSIACAKICELQAYVSTNSADYGFIAEQYGAINHPRDVRAASDVAKDIEVIQDFNVSVNCTAIVYLRPTTPLRNPQVVSNFVDEFLFMGYHHLVAMCKIRDGDFYRNTGYCEVFPPDGFGENKLGVIFKDEVGEIDTEEDFDYIEWRLQKYGSEIWDFLKANYPNPE